MRLIIFGGRDFTDYDKVKRNAKMFIIKHLTNEYEKVEIVSGACDRGVHTFTRPDGTKVYGADGLGERFAAEFEYPVKSFPANWKKYGTAAGPIRNRSMAHYGTHYLGFHDGKTRGTKNMATAADCENLIGEVLTYDNACA